MLDYQEMQAKTDTELVLHFHDDEQKQTMTDAGEKGTGALHTTGGIKVLVNTAKC